MKTKNIFSSAFKDGILLILPFGITIGLIVWIWSFLKAYIPNVTIFLPSALTSYKYFSYITDIVSLMIVLFGITFSGMIASTFLGKFFLLLIDRILMAPTFINPLYKTFKKIAELIFQNDPSVTNTFSKSILVPYPNEYSKSIGFITSNHARHIFNSDEGNNWITVYLPSAPLVSAGFFLLCRKEDTEPCLLKSGNAMSTVISIGVVQHDESANSQLNIEPSTENKVNYLTKSFFNGILILGPLVATISIIAWVAQKLYGILSSVIKVFPPIFTDIIPLHWYDLLFSSVLMIIIILLIILLGLLGESAIGLWFRSISHRLLNAIPMFNSIYNNVNKIIKVFFPDPSQTNKFNQAVLVPYPTEKTLAVGFVTGKDSSQIIDPGHDFVPVFIPTTPIPTTGWFINISKDKIIPLDMSIDKAFALVISSGILVEEPKKSD
ncbi:MAG: DUF502 domain-containing protein [Brevinemataceae bacterium]